MTSQRSSFAEFGARVAQRIEKGRQVYGDRSFEKPLGELVGEIEEELLDIAGWSYVAWCRLHRLEQHSKELTDLQVEVVPSREDNLADLVRRASEGDPK